MIDKNELHRINDFAKLFTDPRFRAAVTYLRENFHGKEASGDEWRGWFNALRALEELATPPQPQVGEKTRQAPYTRTEPQK